MIENEQNDRREVKMPTSQEVEVLHQTADIRNTNTNTKSTNIGTTAHDHDRALPTIVAEGIVSMEEDKDTDDLEDLCGF
eukprot:m.7727 g.7727  ORF g.7727 m.7727 type:complete len:79 (-) comp2897_c0_seq1:179-415(-)